MPRISRELAAQKETFVTDLLKGNSAITLREVTEAVKAKFGASMNAVKIGELRAKLTGTPVVTAEQTGPIPGSTVGNPVDVIVTPGPLTTIGELDPAPTVQPETITMEMLHEAYANAPVLGINQLAEAPVAPAPVLAVPTETVAQTEPVAEDKTTVVTPVPEPRVQTFVQTTTFDENGRPLTSIRPGTLPEVTGTEVTIRPGLTEIIANG